MYAKVRVWAPWSLTVDGHAGVAVEADLYTVAQIHIKARAVVSQRAYLCSGTHDYEDPMFQLVAYPITIGERAWVCAGASAGLGVTVGEGAVARRGRWSRRYAGVDGVRGQSVQALKPRVVHEAP